MEQNSLSCHSIPEFKTHAKRGLCSGKEIKAMASCPANSFIYNASLCACNPGYFRTAPSPGGAGECMPFSTQSNEWASRSGLGVVVDSNDSFVNSIFSFNSLTSMTQSQALVLETTTLAVGLWLIFCIVLRFCPLDDGRSRWFRLRYWLSRLDVCFNTRHWLDEQKIMVKRKTELGGTFSVASFIFFSWTFYSVALSNYFQKEC